MQPVQTMTVPDNVFVRIDQEVLGPFASGSIRTMIDDGLIDYHDELSRDGYSWHRIGPTLSLDATAVSMADRLPRLRAIATSRRAKADSIEASEAKLESARKLSIRAFKWMAVGLVVPFAFFVGLVMSIVAVVRSRGRTGWGSLVFGIGCPLIISFLVAVLRGAGKL